VVIALAVEDDDRVSIGLLRSYDPGSECCSIAGGDHRIAESTIVAQRPLAPGPLDREMVLSGYETRRWIMRSACRPLRALPIAPACAVDYPNARRLAPDEESAAQSNFRKNAERVAEIPPRALPSVR
jgi:hypothetical protein